MAESPLCVLVVEDHPALGRFVSAVLQSIGWIVLGPFGDRDGAAEAARLLPADVALLDRRLNGQEASAIADTLIERGVPCVLMSGYARDSLPERFRDLPFLEKPFTVEALLAALRGACGRL